MRASSVHKIVDKYVPIFIKNLELDIMIMVQAVNEESSYSAHTEFYRDGCCITIYAKEMQNKKDVILTLFHEMLHIRYHKIPKTKKNCGVEEENFIRDIEKTVRYLLERRDD